jgi:hypothetical protein
MRQQSLVVLVLTLMIAATPLTVLAKGKKTIRKQLEAAYVKIVDALKKSDPITFEELLAPDFQVTLIDGQTHDREWLLNYLRNNAKTFKVLKLSIEIKELTISGNEAIALIEQKSSRTFTDAEGKPHQLDVGAIQQETWVKTAEGWKLKHNEELKRLYVKQDGKPVAQ